MARYSPELLAALRQRYEQTDQPMNALAADFGIGITTLQTLVRKNGWTQRSKRMRECPSTLQLLAEAEMPIANLPERETSAAPTSVTLAPPKEAAPSSLPMIPPPSPTASSLSPVERLEALVVKELESEETARAACSMRPRSRSEAERHARTLSVLTQTLKTLQGMRAGGGTAASSSDDDVPEDMDAFREKLARRIRAFVESRVGRERMVLDRQFAALTDDQVKELAQVGRERGMEAFLGACVDEPSKISE